MAKCKDHLGKEYESKKEMCDSYGISCRTYQRRRRMRCSIEKALVGATCEEWKYDHDGNPHASIAKMCKAYEIPQMTYYTRIQAGWSMEKALTEKNMNEASKGSHVGDVSMSTCGQKMKLIKYISNRNVLLEFEDGTRINASYVSFRNGKIKNLNLDTGHMTPRIAYRMSNGEVYLYCKCRKCGKEYIGAWQDVCAHECSK